MQIGMFILLGAGIWGSVVLLAMSLCKAAKAGDQVLETDYMTAEESGWQEADDFPEIQKRIAHDAIELDLQAHRRPTRVAFDRRTERLADSAGADPAGAGPRHPARPPRDTDPPMEPRGRLDCSPITTQTTPTTAASSAMSRQLLNLSEAADTLRVTPDVVLAWETRYGYPKAHHSWTTPGRAYSRAEVLALAESLRNGLSIRSAISVAQAATNRRRATSAGRKRQPPTFGSQ
jgi:hypothetical protein